jgi:Fe-S cluster biogenesis protein NfuA
MTDSQQKFGRIEELINKLEKAADPAARATARELVQLLMEIHGEGLARILEIAASCGPVGLELINRLGGDELARNLLLLYGLHPTDLDTRVAEALEKVRPYLRSRDADVEPITIADGVVTLRLTGKAHGCTAETLKGAIEEALYNDAPDLVSISIETAADAPASVFIPLTELRTLTAPGR